MSHLASLLQDTGQNGRAELIARRALSGLVRQAGDDRRVTVDARATLAGILRFRHAPGDQTEAEKLQAAAVAFYESRVNPDYSSTNELRLHHVEMLLALDRAPEAEAPARRIMESYRRIFGPENLNTLKAEARLARVLIAAGAKLDEAERLVRHSAEATPRITSPTEDYAVYHGATLADARRARGSPEEGLRQCDRLLDLIGPTPGNSPWLLAYLRGVRGRCLMDLGRPDEAESALRAALADADRWDDPVSAIRVGVLRAGVRLLTTMGKTEEAEAWRKKIPPA
jgi:tetratricopeptide (TPR) repeat protein